MSDQAKLRLFLEALWRDVAAAPEESRDPVATVDTHVNSLHGAVRVGVDLAGFRHLLVPVDQDSDLRDERSSGVRLATRILLVEDVPTRFADLVCRRRDLDGVFTGLCADVCERVLVDPASAGSRLADVLAGWRDLLSGRSEPWTGSRLAGLFGELLVLERILGEDTSAGTSWLGPTGAPQDFRSGRHAIEVKATTALNGRAVRVHGSDQLETPADGTLTLAWFRLVSDANGRSMRELISTCLQVSSNAALLSRLDDLKLPALSDPLLATAFACTEQRWYEVDVHFPRITPDRFVGGALPHGVGNVEYTLDLDYVSGPMIEPAAAVSRLVEDL